MTTPSQFLDQGNALLAPVPARLETGSISSPAGALGVLTIRTASTTLTVFLGQEDVRSWAAILAELATQLGGKLVTASPLDLSVLDGTRNRRQGPLH